MHNVTLIKGDGIGPEISDTVVEILDIAGAKINWDIQTAVGEVAETESDTVAIRGI